LSPETTPRPRANDTAWKGIVALGALVTLSVVAGFVRDFSGDFHWHVVQGAWMLDHKAVLRTDPFSYSAFGQHEFCDGWLSDVVLALGYRVMGYPGCYLLRGVALAITFGLLGREMVRQGLRGVTASVLLSLVLGELLFRFYLRPETFTFPILAALLTLLGEHERTGRRAYLWATLPLIALWANVHASVLLGLALLALYGGELALRGIAAQGRERRSRIAVGVGLPVLGVMASVCNSQGLREPSMFLAVRGDDPTYHAGVEWSRLDLDTMSVAFPVMLAVVLALALAAGTRGSVWRTGYAALLFLLALRYGRFVKVLLLACAPLVAHNLVALKDRLARIPRGDRWERIGRVLVGVTAIASASLLFGERRLTREVGLGLDPGVYPEAACRFAAEAPLAGHMLNSFNFGSYLMFCLPRHPVIIDQRAAELYSPEFSRTYYAARASPDALDAYAERMDVTWAFVTYDDPFTQDLAADPSWALDYFDDTALIYVRRGKPANVSALRDAFLWLDPMHIWLVPFLEGPAIAEAKVELARQVTRCPECTATHACAAAVALAERDLATFETERARIAPSPLPGWALVSGMHALIAHEPAAAAHWFGELGRFMAPGEIVLVEAMALAWSGDVDGARHLLLTVPADLRESPSGRHARDYVARMDRPR